MVLTKSTHILTGSAAPDFTLPDTRDGQSVTLSDYADKPILVVFMCNHCPYVVHLINELTALAHEFAQIGIATITISSNDSTSYPQDGPEKMGALARQKKFRFPYCFDEDQSIAKAYGAVCTPDIFLFDAKHNLYYHGQFDETRPGSGAAHGGDLKAAGLTLLAGQVAPDNIQPSVGCSIKWKA